MRTSIKDLQIKVETINGLLNRPKETINDVNKGFNIGNLHIGQSNGTFSLNEIVNNGGAIYCHFTNSTKSRLGENLNAMIKGIYMAQKQMEVK